MTTIDFGQKYFPVKPSAWQISNLVHCCLTRWHLLVRFTYGIAAPFYAPVIEDRGILFLSCLSLCHSVWNLNLGYNFWMVSTRALIFHMYVLYDKSFPWVSNYLTSWPWPRRLTYFFKNLNLGYNFWMVSTRALIFHMCVPYDKTFLWVPQFLTSWPWSLTYFSKNLTLATTFEW